MNRTENIFSYRKIFQMLMSLFILLGVLQEFYPLLGPSYGALASPENPLLDRTRRAVNDNAPDPNVALEGQCIVVCDADVVGLKPGSKFEPGSDRKSGVDQERENDQGRNEGGQTASRSSKLRDNIPFSGPNLCGGLVGVGRRARRIAFSVMRSSVMGVRESGINNKRRVTFDYVMVNVGNAFDLQSSTFVAPVSGVYSLAFQVYRLYNRNSLTIALTVNEITIFTGFANGDNGNYEPAHNSGLLHLGINDRVELVVSNGNLDSGWKYSTFSGHLVFEDEDF